jgi:hypothetical protein
MIVDGKNITHGGTATAGIASKGRRRGAASQFKNVNPKPKHS